MTASYPLPPQGLSPAAIRLLSPAELTELAEGLRRFLVASVSRTGGHLGPNLGVVELTLALHRVFDSPRTPIIFDTGHQSYVHKLLTGRAAAFTSLRSSDGLSGYPNRAESPHDLVENSHASTALSYADGLSRAFALLGDIRPVVVVVGDGALTGGMAWEALNNLAVARRPVVVVLNDNGRSYAPTVGALSRHLRELGGDADRRRLVQLLGGDAAPPDHAPVGNLFELMGLDYVGPIDGHDLAALEQALRQVSDTAIPVVVHCRTTKGRGHPPAEADIVDHMHTVPVGTQAPARTVGTARLATRTWTDAFATRLQQLVAERPDLIALTAAMAHPTGLARTAARWPDRVVDVGIAEQHAVTSAAGLAMGGLHPVVALYATFATRAFDQTLLDVGLHRLPVTFVLDRAGITGPDGPSHHGIWDLVLFGMVPGMHVAAPRDGEQLSALLDEAVRMREPTMLRFPKGSPGPAVVAEGRRSTLDLLRMPAAADVLLVSVGAMAGPALAAATRLSAAGVECTVADPRWVLPVSPDLIPLARSHRLVVTVEDGLRDGGVGSHLQSMLADAAVRTPVGRLGLPTAFVPHGSRGTLLARHGLNPDGIAAEISQLLSRAPRVRRRGAGAENSASARRGRFFVLRGGAARPAGSAASSHAARAERHWRSGVSR